MGDLLKKRLKQLQEQKNEIDKLLKINDTESALQMIRRYGEVCRNYEYYAMLATAYFQQGELDRTLSVLLEGIAEHPLNTNLHFNLGIIYEERGMELNAVTHYTYAAKYAKNKTETDMGLEAIKRSFRKFNGIKSNNKALAQQKLDESKMILSEKDARAYPLDGNLKSMIRQVQNKGTSEEYMVNLYQQRIASDVTDNTRLLFKSELFKGQVVDGSLDIPLEEPSVIPVSFMQSNSKLEIELNGATQAFTDKYLAPNRYHYLRFDDKGILKIKSDKPAFVAHPIKMYDRPAKPKLVLKIFIDGLSYKFLEQAGLETTMPNTYNLFKDGLIANHCIATSEWTLPCKASIHTGKYSVKHKLLHPNFPYPFEKYNKLMSEYMKEAGYYTTYICTNWRTTPTFGYYKGFDRILYQNFVGGMDCRDVVTETIEQIEAFPNRNQFIAISLMDLHNVPDEVENNLVAQSNTAIRFREDNKIKNETSVLQRYDENKIEKYGIECKRLDIYLGILFDYIMKKYSREDVLIVLHSDHGQTFLEQEATITHESRRKIPLMVYGQDVQPLMTDEIIEMVDILPIMLNQCGLPIPDDIDGKLPVCFGGESEREYAVTNIIHPGQPYRAIVSDSQHIYKLESTDLVDQNLTFKLFEFNYTLQDRLTGQDVSSQFKDKVNHYEQIVFQHIHDFIKLENYSSMA